MSRALRCCVVAAALAGASAAWSQQAGHGHSGASHVEPGGYAGMQTREIKALSPEQVRDLREGRGMGASLPAELNGVPGPMHVLQLSRQLGVTPAQQAALERITAEMSSSARRLGGEVVAAEAELDRAFQARAIDEQGVRDATARIARLQGELRAVHLTAHLHTRQLLSDRQVAAYNEARGYTAAPPHSHGHGHRAE